MGGPTFFLTSCQTGSAGSYSVFVLPVSGLGYIVGSQVSAAAHNWHSALRVSSGRSLAGFGSAACVPVSDATDCGGVCPPPGDPGARAGRRAAAAVCGPGAQERSGGGSVGAAPDQLADRPAGAQQEVGSLSPDAGGRGFQLLTRLSACSCSFVLSTFGFTAVAFVTGSLALWAPTFLFRAAVFAGTKAPCVDEAHCSSSDRRAHLLVPTRLPSAPQQL